jgi:hypothetical protein
MRVPHLACLALLSLASFAHAQEATDGTSAPPPSNLESGGLRPPEAVQSEQPPPAGPGEEQVETELEKADTEDTGRGLEFVWLNGEVGYQIVGLQTLSDGDLVDGTLIENNQSGLVFGGGLGVRLFTITLGARFRYGSFEAWDMWSINAEGAFHIPLGKLDFYVGVGAGYVALGNIQPTGEDAGLLSDIGIAGFDLRAGVGLDYYLSNTFSVGVNLGGEALFLRRKLALANPADGTGSLSTYGDDGSSVGAAFTPMAVIGLHF